MTVTSAHAKGATRTTEGATRIAEGAGRTAERAHPHQARTLWTDHDTGEADAPEQTFAEIFGDADRVRIALWIERTAPVHGGLFCADTCATDLGLPEAGVRSALGPLRHIGMVQYQSGLYMRRDHPLWAVLKVFRTFAGSAPPREASATPAAEPTPARQDARAATFYFG